MIGNCGSTTNLFVVRHNYKIIHLQHHHYHN